MKRLLFIALLIPLTSGCSLFTPPMRYVNDGAQEQIAFLDSLKQGPGTFRGTGSMVLTEKGEVQRYRLAWVGSQPDRLRMEVLASSTPVESLAYDGTRLQLLSRLGQHPFYSDEVQNPSLKRITGVPLGLTEIHALLSGHIDVGDHESARLLFSESGDALLVVRPDRTTIKEIQLSDEGLPLRVEVTRSGNTLYTLDLTRKETTKGPSWYEIAVIKAGDSQATLTVETLTTGVKVPEDAFTLSP